jgi:hypothetical protein
MIKRKALAAAEAARPVSTMVIKKGKRRLVVKVILVKRR